MPLPSDYIGSNQVVTRRGRRITTAKIVKQSWTDPAAADLELLSVEHLGQDAAGTVSMTLVATVLSPCRNVVITVTHDTSVVAMSGVITGTDINGKPITEAWSVTATGTSKTFTGAKAFKTVTSITEVVVADASANTVKAGSGNKLGLSGICSVASAVKEIAAGSVVTNGTLVAGSTSASADARGTYAPNTVPDASNDYTVYYLSDSPELSD